MNKLKKASLILLPVLVFVLIVSTNFFKPFGFFRESNPAMVCINANIWKQHPFLEQHRIPIETYTFDADAKPATQMWSTVTSFGYGWFLVPYLFFSVFHLAPGEIAIRIFSLLWLAVTLLASYLVCKNLTRNSTNGRTTTYLTIIFCVFNAGNLWYDVNGYVHETAVLPFYFLVWLFYIKFLNGSSRKWLAALTIGLAVAVQFDWLPCFQALVITIHLLLKRKNLHNRYAFLFPGIGIISGLGWIVYTYSKWATLPIYINFLKDKFTSRTIGSGGLEIIHGLNFNFNPFLFYAISFGLLAAVFLYGIFRTKVNTIVWLMIFSVVLHHLLFWGFTTEHDHSVIKMTFPIAFMAALVLTNFPPMKRAVAACTIILFNIGLYLFLHNFYTKKGMYADPNFCYKVGKTIRENFRAENQVVFVDTEGKHLLQIEFYAGKSYIPVSSIDEARQLFRLKYQDKSGYFINYEHLGKIVRFR